jgi:16S rRNA (cytosine967-C5)-methyltransferase
LRKFAGIARQHGESAITTANAPMELADRSAHPLWLIERWSQEFGFEVARKICAYDQEIPQTVVSLRDAAIANELKSQKIELSPGRLLTSAYRVLAGDVTGTSLFRKGRLMVQDEASQLVSLLVGEGLNILDCCAAPGGKTRILAERNPNASIVAVELHPHRARTLRKLAAATSVRVIVADTRNLPVASFFDRVLADVPCSGTGTLGRNPEIKWRLKNEDFADLQSRQVAILQSAMQRVSRGGRVVYSTCSLETEENSAVVERAMSTEPSFRVLSCRAELERLREQGELRWEDIDSLTSGPYLRTIPGVHPCDGFFAALLQKI